MDLDLLQVKSINYYLLKQKVSLNINDALHNLSRDINRNCIKNKNNCSIDIHSKILDNYIYKPDVNNDKSQEITTQEPVHKFIDDLVEGIETSLPQSNLKYLLCLKTKIWMSSVNPNGTASVWRQSLRMTRVYF